MVDSTVQAEQHSTKQAPPEQAFQPWSGAHKFIQAYAQNPDLQHDPELQQLHESLTAHASVCSYCGVGCPYAVVTASNGNQKVTPLSDLGLCVKGETSLLTGGDPIRDQKLARRGRPSDRIRVPMIRRHDGNWRDVSWEEALDRAAWLFLHVREWVGPEGIAIYGNGQKTVEAIWMASLYKLVFKVSTLGANSEHCLASAGAAHELNFGNEASFTWKEFEELALCDVAILHGTNPVITFPQAYAKLMRNTAAMKVVIDPVESDTVLELRKADPDRTLHIRFEQGGDVLFNLAVAHVILQNGWDDRAYLERAVEPESLADFRSLCLEERCSPEAVAQQIALEDDDPAALAATIRHYAALIAQPNAAGERPRPAFVSSMGINQSTGSYGFSTNLNLLLLTGNVGRRGAGSLRIAGQSNATSELMLGFNGRRMVFNLDVTNPEHRRELAAILEIPEENIADHPGTPVARMADDDYLYCFLFMGTQFTRNMPRLGHWKRRIGRSFNIVIDPFLPDGALDHADVLLPSLTYTERMGVIQRGDRTLQLQQPLTPPPPMAWSDEQILARLALTIAKRLRDPDTAALNQLDPDAVDRAFRRYVDADGKVDAAGVFDHLVHVSRQLNVYNRLENSDGEAISHAMLREQAGLGVQWQGDERYALASEKGAVFPRLRHDDLGKARLVRPPERFLERLVTRGDEKLRSLITGRGRPGVNYKRYVARYNSGIKTLPITAPETDRRYWLEMHPAYARQRGLQQGDPVRITSHHGTVIANVSLNDHVPHEFPFLDFVPGEANRLTDYLDADRFTNQSLIKRTPIRVELLTPQEVALWTAPDRAMLCQVVSTLAEHYRSVYPTAEEEARFARGEEGAPDWLPLTMLQQPQTAHEQELATSVGAFAAFLQRIADDTVVANTKTVHGPVPRLPQGAYRQAAAHIMQEFTQQERDQFLTILLPLLKKLDYDALMLPILSDLVGPIPLLRADGTVTLANLHDAHQSAVIELKEEVVAVQLFMAMKHGLELLYGKGVPVPQEEIAVISGIRIPCAADIPAYYMGISPAHMEATRLIHCAQLGAYAITVVDRKGNRAVKIETTTGILPRDRELLRLRKTVIMEKRVAPRAEHRRFFERLTELICQFVRLDDQNFRVVGPLPFPWHEFSRKLAFMPGRWQSFRDFLLRTEPSTQLASGLVELEILDAQRDEALVAQLLRGDYSGNGQTNGTSPVPPAAVATTATTENGGDGYVPSNAERRTYASLIHDTALTTEEKVSAVIAEYIQPLLENDGGRVEYLGFDTAVGEVAVRFLGSCANCPASILSVETLVKPPLLNIPGVHHVVHRTQLRHGDRGAAQPITLEV
ncbi:MAG: molybdopterin-dependent oxidoreductase [Caldilineaceae bacterium]